MDRPLATERLKLGQGIGPVGQQCCPEVFAAVQFFCQRKGFVQRCGDVDLCFGKVRSIHGADHDEVVLFRRLRKQKAHIAAYGKILAQVFFARVHVVEIANLVLGIRAAKALGAGGQNDDGAALAHHRKGVGQGPR